jgi:hypothetical protein
MIAKSMDVIGCEVLLDVGHVIVIDGGPLPKQLDGMRASMFCTGVEKHAEL